MTTAYALPLPTHTRGEMSIDFIARVYRLYAFNLWPVQRIADHLGVSRAHVHAAVDQALRWTK
ncbi:hypothetical protein [Methylocystis sp. S23]